MTDQQKELIAIEVIRTLYNQFEKFPEDDTSGRNSPFHIAFLNAFTKKLENKVISIPIFINLASWMHGLNTSLGQSFLEKTAHILCNGEKKDFTTKKRTGLKVTQNQKNTINKIITDLTNGNRIPNIELENSEFDEQENLELDIEATDFTVDVYFQDIDQIVCIELKTVKPNKGIFKVEKEKILEAKIALKNHYLDKEVQYLLGFPFDPLSDLSTHYDKSRFMDYSVGFRKYFAEDEFLLSSELWNFLSGEENTMDTILVIINKIATPEFLDKFEFINDFKNIFQDKENYISSLKNWYLFSNAKVAENFELLSQKAKSNKTIHRYLNQTIFDNNGDYKKERIQNLII